MMRRIRFPEPATTGSNPSPLVLRAANRLSTIPEMTTDQPAPKKLGGLVLTRHLGESIMIGDDVEVEVVGLRSGSARLKIVAPKTVEVHRREVFDEIRSNPRAPRFARTETNPTPAPITDPVAGDRPAKASKGGLVLTRNVLESIMIGDDVELAVVEVRPTTVKIKIVAPKAVSVHRREVYDSIRGDQD